MRRSQLQIVDNYGLHLDQIDKTWWLLQQDGATNALGLPKGDCPFRIKSPLLMCPHRLDLLHPLNEDETKLLKEYERRLAYSPLLQFFDPATQPKIKAAYVSTSGLKQYQTLIHLQNLSNLSVGCSNSARFVTSKNYDQVIRRLNSSNLASYFIYEMSADHTKMLSDLATTSFMSKGKLIFAGKAMPMFKLESVCTLIEFEPVLADWIDDIGPDMVKRIGAARVKQFMRN